MLTYSRLREVLKYNPRTGLFTWLVSGPNRVAGTVAGSVNRTDGWYIQVGIDGKNYLAHRLAWLYMTGEWPAVEIDHKDLDKANNRWRNLRPATHKQNCENGPVRSHSQSRVKGVYREKHGRQRWQAYITHNWRRIHLGRFDSEKDAVRARRAAERLYFTHA